MSRFDPLIFDSLIIFVDHIEEIRNGIANVSIPQPFSDLLCEN